jgi:NADH-quinone oxidoreductase subunit K
MHPVIPYCLAAGLFAIGLYGVLARRNAVLLLMSVELLLSGINLVFVTADVSTVGLPRTGQVFALFVIVLAAAEIGVGLALVLRLYRARATIDVEKIDVEKIDVEKIDVEKIDVEKAEAEVEVDG